MLKFTLDTFHFMGFLCETWPWQKAFENTQFNYVTVEKPGFCSHSWKPKDDPEMHFRMSADHLHLCAPYYLQFSMPRLSSPFLSSVANKETEQNKEFKTNCSSLLLFLILVNSVNIQPVTSPRHPRFMLATSLSLTCLYSIYCHGLLILPTKQFRFVLFLHKHQPSSLSFFKFLYYCKSLLSILCYSL